MFPNDYFWFNVFLDDNSLYRKLFKKDNKKNFIKFRELDYFLRTTSKNPSIYRDNGIDTWFFKIGFPDSLSLFDLQNIKPDPINEELKQTNMASLFDEQDDLFAILSKISPVIIIFLLIFVIWILIKIRAGSGVA